MLQESVDRRTKRLLQGSQIIYGGALINMHVKEHTDIFRHGNIEESLYCVTICHPLYGDTPCVYDVDILGLLSHVSQSLERLQHAQ